MILYTRTSFGSKDSFQIQSFHNITSKKGSLSNGVGE